MAETKTKVRLGRAILLCSVNNSSDSLSANWRIAMIAHFFYLTRFHSGTN
jgi:hypothetical protein